MDRWLDGSMVRLMNRWLDGSIEDGWIESEM